MKEWARELGDEVPIVSGKQAAGILPLVPSPQAVLELIECPALPVEGRQSLRLLYASGVFEGDLGGASLESGLLTLANGRVAVVPATFSLPPSVSVKQLEEWLLLAAGQTGLLVRFQGCSRKLSTRVLRHAYAVHCLENGMDLFALSQLLGHADLVTVEMYLPAAMAACRGPYEKCHPLLGGRSAINPPAALSVDEVLALIEAPDVLLHRLAIRVLYATGLRESELTHLAFADLDVGAQRIFVREGKGPKDRYGLIDARTMELLNQIPHEPAELIFAWSRQTVWNIVGRAAEKVGLDLKYPGLRISPHTIRHCYATHCHQNGMEVTVLAKLLGHPFVNDTIIYIHTSPEKLAEDYDRAYGGWVR